MTKSNVFLLSVLLIASLFNISHTLELFSIPIDEVRIRGTLRCSLNGNPTAPPVSNATVYLKCGDSNTTIAEALTDAFGGFVFVLIDAVETILFNPSDCVVQANLPTGTCQIYPPDGLVYASVNLARIAFTGLLNVAYYAVTEFFSAGP
ncbi:hypothetical protein N665_0883s0003 [Sinapis alba]|nr:hypothetical protein N665_0883s0003 [Sinapis alba]